MEIWVIIGMLAAFFFGAHIRKPFEIHRRTKEVANNTETVQSEDVQRLQKQMNNFMNFGVSGKEQKELDDED
ncbi:MAG: hypothetical protein RR292_07860 [Christensenellaceae bacterium]